MEVEYCEQCSCPLEYCEYASCARVAAARLESVETSASAVEGHEDDVKAVDDGSSTGKVSKKSKGKSKEVVITRLSRNRKKMITNVAGLDAFDVDLKEASKMFGKKFACGCSITKGPTLKDELDLQGDYSEQLGELILSKYPNVEESDIRYSDKSKF